MEDKDKNPIENSPAFSTGSTPLENQSVPPVNPTENTGIGVNPNPSVPEFTPPPPPIQTPTPMPPSPSSGGKGSTIIVGGILLLFIAIVLALYWLILRQPSEQAVQTPPPAAEPTLEITPAALNEEEQEVIDIDIEENLDEEFTPINEDLNLL